MNEEDDLILELSDIAGEVVSSRLDRDRLNERLLSEFSSLPKNPVEPPVLSRRINQISSLVEGLQVSFGPDLKLVIRPDEKDRPVFDLLRFGCEWHEPLEIEPIVRECLPG